MLVLVGEQKLSSIMLTDKPRASLHFISILYLTRHSPVLIAMRTGQVLTTFRAGWFKYNPASSVTGHVTTGL